MPATLDTDTLDGPPLQGVSLDHVAVAVADLDAARAWWVARGARPLAGISLATFSTEQLRLSNHGKVELISPGRGEGGSFVDGFLRRFGSGTVHHITLKVPAPLTDAVGHLQRAGLDVVDVATDDPHWHESFLRPSQVGGVIVQVAWADGTDEDFARRSGRPTPAPVDPDAPALQEVVLGHPDLDRARSVWQLLGAEVADAGPEALQATFVGSPITVRIRRHDIAGPLGLVMKGLPASAATTLTPALLEA